MRISRVLLVDDDPIANFVSQSAIISSSLIDEAVVKISGEEALQYLYSCKQKNDFPDLILLDLKMPGMDGFEFLQKFETFCKNFQKDVAIVILSESKSPEDIIRLYRMGRYTLIKKPLNLDKIMDIYHKFFRFRFIQEFNNDFRNESELSV